MSDAEALARQRAKKAESRRRWVERQNLTPEKRRRYLEVQEASRQRHEASLPPGELDRRLALYRATYAEARRRRTRMARRARERAAAWAQANPERANANKVRYRVAHPERVRESGRAYYHRNRDEIRRRREAREDPQQVAEARRRYAANYVRKASDWKPSESQREAYNRAHADRRRLERRLAAAGLPPRRLQKVSASQRRFNEREATAFFARRRSAGEIAAARKEDARTPPELLRGFMTDLRMERTRQELAAVARKQLRRHGDRLRREIEMDATARALRGAPPLDPELEVYRRLSDLVSAGFPKLTAGRGPVAILPPAWRVPGHEPHAERGELGR